MGTISTRDDSVLRGLGPGAALAEVYLTLAFVKTKCDRNAWVKTESSLADIVNEYYQHFNISSHQRNDRATPR